MAWNPTVEAAKVAMSLAQKTRVKRRRERSIAIKLVLV
jgi:hypothetical protein